MGGIQYLSFDEKTWAIDIETDGLRPTCIWVMVAGNMITGEEIVLTDLAEITEWVETKREEGCKFVLHNGLHFDGPVLNNLASTRIGVSNVVDTMLLSMLYNPNLDGKHSLDSWGIRLDFPKIPHEDWSVLSDAMIERCRGDVELTKRVYGYLCRKMNTIGFSEEGIALEHQAWVLVRKQHLNGFHFDYNRADQFRNSLMVVAAEMLNSLQTVYFPPVLEPVRQYKQARKQDGSWSKGYLDHKERFVRLDLLPDNEYMAYDYVQFDPASPAQRVEKLLALGWEPKEFTPPSIAYPEGQPQPTRKGKLSPSLVAFVEAQDKDNGVRLLADWMTINNRISMIQTWMNAYNPDTECIHGTLWLASTLRYKHSGPNTANAPAVKEDKEGHPVHGEQGGWAYECRDLWSTRDFTKRRLVGVDAKGIQLRVLAHYLNEPGFTAAILSEDPHSANAKMMGLPNRGIAKTITYAIVMGAGDAKVATEARISLAEAKENKAKFFEKVPGLPALIRTLKGSIKKTGRIELCDGSRILVESDHTAIPYLLQGDESRIMKKAKIIVDRLIRKQKLDVLFVGDIHDEWQCDIAVDHVDAFIALCHQAFKEAGESFKYNLPIECEAKVGLTWAETH